MNYEGLYNLIRYSICGEPLPAGFSCGEKEMKTYLKIASLHDISAVVVYALDKNGFLGEGERAESIRDEMLFSASRIVALEYFSEEVTAALEEGGFDYILLKGAEIRKLYPKDFFRTSSDIDILVRKKDYLKCERYLKAKLGLKEKQRTRHDVALSRSEEETVELHFSLIEKDSAKEADEFLSAVWDHAESVEGHKFRLKNEFFIFYLIAHLLKHFLYGGCGLRFFIDLFLCGSMPVDGEALDKMIEKSGLLVFYGRCKDLVEAIFCGAESDETTKRLEDFVIRSGIYGKMQTHVAVEAAKKGKGAGYIFKRIFLPYEELVLIYPKLEGKRFLTPWYQFVRFFKMLFGGKLKRNLNEVKALKNYDERKAEEIDSLFHDIGVFR